jgi:PEP-CTERM motif
MKSIGRNMLPVCRRAPLGLKLFLAVLVLSVLGSTAARADIIGDTVVIQYLFPDSSTQFGLSATGVVTSTGVTLNLFGNQTVTVFGGDVQMVGISNSFFQTAAFNGVSIQDLTNPSAFTTFSIDPASNIPGFGLSDVSIQGGLLFINYEGLTTPIGSLAQVDFSGGNSTVPEPSTITLLLLGSGALSTLLRRRGAVR